MNLEIIINVIFAVALIRLVEYAFDTAMHFYYRKKRRASLDKIMAELDIVLSQEKPKPVKRAATKTKAVRKPVKKAVAKKKR